MDSECAGNSSSASIIDSSTTIADASADVVKEKSSSAVQLLPPLSSLPENESLDLQRAYSCRICFEAFTKEVRYPVSLNCGHSFCVVCIKKMNGKKSSIMCGICRKHTFSSHKRLGKNFLLIDILEKNGLLGVEEKKNAKPKSEVEKVFDPTKNDDLSNPEDTDSTFEEDESQHGGGAHPNDFNSFSIAVDEIEEFHDQLENIQDLLYGLERGVPRSDDFDRQLEELRSEMGRVEQRLRTDRATFRNIANKSRQLYRLVSQTGAIAQQQSNSSQQPAGSVATDQGGSSNNLRTWLGNHFITGFSVANRASQDIRLNIQRIPFFNGEEEEDQVSIPSEDDWITSGEETEDTFASTHIERENRIVVFLSANFIRVLTRSADNTQINQVECYLCNVVIQYSYQNAMQHINGRRHREYIRANQASPSEISPVEGENSSSSTQLGQINARTWELDEDEDFTHRQMDRNIILHALRHGNAFEIGNTTANFNDSWDNGSNDTQPSRTSRNNSLVHPQSSLPGLHPRLNASRFPTGGFGSDPPRHHGFRNNPTPSGSRERGVSGRGTYSQASRQTRPGYASGFGRSLNANQTVMEEEENDDWGQQTTNWTPLVPHPVLARSTTAPGGSQSNAEGRHTPADIHADRCIFGAVRRAPGFANSTANNSANSQGFSSGRFGNQPTRNAQQDDDYTCVDSVSSSGWNSDANSGSKRSEKSDDRPESSPPSSQQSASIDWAQLSDRDSSPSRTRRRSRNSNASNTSSSNRNRKGRHSTSDSQIHRSNCWNNGRVNNTSFSLNSAIARNLANIGTTVDNNQPEENNHLVLPNVENRRQESSKNTNKALPSNGRQQLCFEGANYSSSSVNCQCPTGSARTDGYVGRFGQNGGRGKNQSSGSGQGTSNQQHRKSDRGGRQSGGGRFSTSDWE